MKIFGERLKQVRIEKGISISELSRATNISKSSLYKIKKHGTVVRVGVVIKIAVYFNIKSDYFLGLIEDKLPIKQKM